MSAETEAENAQYGGARVWQCLGNSEQQPQATDPRSLSLSLSLSIDRSIERTGDSCQVGTARIGS